MKLARELYSPVILGPKLAEQLIFLRIDIDQPINGADLALLDHKLTRPVLCSNASIPLSRFDPESCNQLVTQFVIASQQLADFGFRQVVIGADDDSILQKILSPRFNSIGLTLRKMPLLNVFLAVKPIMDDVGVLLTVEELAPGGLDATDGISIAQDLEDLGLKTIIATSGTRDFPTLYHRRHTQKKARQEHEFVSNVPELAAAKWLLDNTNLAVWGCAFFDEINEAIALAKALGIEGLIERENKNILN